MKKTTNIKFLGIRIDNHLNWKNHRDQMIPKFIGMCYTVRMIFHISNIDTLQIIFLHNFNL